MVKRKNSGHHPATTATSATRGANEWGLPNWTDAGDYGDWENWKFSRWRWEFNRRNSNYRSQAMEFFEILKTRDALTRDLRANKTPESRNRFNKLADLQAQSFTAFWRQWGYIEILDPSTSDYPDERLKILRSDGLHILDGSPSSEVGRSSLSPLIGQTTITFSLDKPLGEQLKSASVELKRKQKSLHGKLLQTRHHDVKRLEYLRTLDAREAMPKANWREFTEALFNAGLLGRHKSPEGGYCDPPPQAGRDKLNAANALRFNF
ncbi:hypothetical protein OA238_c43770 [Octadecabacter arcticus 238]|jgi:hypothetical protein|uniref:Uncharacterized protein n=1 Tax=Octadecabacter arcticus 238 TaxID=391616 RepID=M9RPZ3_9RHOB|nr:hypothetical protein [Octadecabacter arcticus]AGI74267.1 hypothetical protein OA238_c43770 [Octadecabacter arcticus 238]